MSERTMILEAIRAWVNQRPGLIFGNYGDTRAYRAELRGINRDKRDAEVLLDAVINSDIPLDTLKEAFIRAFSGRLSWDGAKLSYCEGQYWPTEYRKAACAVLASALWQHTAKDYEPGSGMAIRKAFRKRFGRSIAARWFH